MRNVTDILRYPRVYHAFQRSGGFFGARVKAISAYLPIRTGDKVIDIGCGPGFIVEHLPPDIAYWGFDTDESYIAFANRRFGDRGRFVCGLFDEACARSHAPVDVFMMNGVLHHLGDGEAHRTLGLIRQALGNQGRLFTLDGCFVDGQPALARYFLDHDRGEHVRTPDGYRSLIKAHFEHVEMHIDHGLSWMPYTWLITVCRN